MSYDISFSVRVDGWDGYAEVGYPSEEHPTYNYGAIFRKCMDWDYSQSKQKENGEYETEYYKCDDVILKVEKGIRELTTNSKDYRHLLPSNGWGNLSGAIESLESIREKILELGERIPLEHIYMSW